MSSRAFLIAALWCLAACGAQPTGKDSSGNAELTPCQGLLLRYCGSSVAGDSNALCRGSPSCEAARLTAVHEASNCDARLQESGGWQECHADAPLSTSSGGIGAAPDQSCLDLVTKVCGAPRTNGAHACDADAACISAQEISVNGGFNACVDALGDDTSFPRCTRP